MALFLVAFVVVVVIVGFLVRFFKGVFCNCRCYCCRCRCRCSWSGSLREYFVIVIVVLVIVIIFILSCFMSFGEGRAGNGGHHHGRPAWRHLLDPDLLTTKCSHVWFVMDCSLNLGDHNAID